MKTSRLPLVLIALTSLLSSSALAETTPRRTISTSGNAAIQVTPDEVVVTLGVETSHTEILAAREQNDRVIMAIRRAAEKNNIPRERVQTDYMSIEPRWDSYDRNRIFLGYWCTKTVVIRIGDINQFEQVLTDALMAGANYVHGVEFRTTELRKHRDRARQLAIGAAREKAEALAGELGLKVGTASSIGEGSSGWGMPSFWGSRRGSSQAYQNVQVEAPSSGSDNGESPLAPGQINITADVSVTFDLETTGTLTAADEAKAP